MPSSWRNLLLGLTLLLATGAGIGWLYGRPAIGLLVASLAALLWQVRQLLAFERALRSEDESGFGSGDGIWAQLYSLFSLERKKVERHRQRYRNLLKEIRKSTNAMPDAAVVVDKNNEIIMCNRAAKQLLGLRPKKDRGQRIDNILRHRGLSKLLTRNDFKSSVDMPSPVREGDWLSCRVVPYGADQKLLLTRDITERLRLNKMRRDFVANASHELRSPLTVLTGYLEGLTDDDLPEDLRQPFAQMQSQAKRMNQVVSELLELSRLEGAGRASLDNTVDVAGLMQSTARSWAGKDGVATVTVDADDSLLLLGNATQIESVLTNLVSNAVRFTPVDGEIRLKWFRHKDTAVLEVSDTGEGIAPEDVPRLTERFFRVDRGRARSDGGVGLGLAIVKHIVNRHDGRLVVDSVPGEGSDFRCTFDKQRIADRESDADQAVG